jgi:predicted nucleotidyltransferase
MKDPVITSTTQPLQSVLRDLKQYLQTHYADRLSQVILFGSYARQEATADSDVDVLIVLKDPVDASAELSQTSEFVAQLCLDYNLLIARFFLPQSRFETENTPLLRNIRREGVTL